ncbi:MAG: FAD-binding oxidoreductase [Phycisphaeraceae bacterium]|nr:MAG: FAD-binding oxidoreductase [Phycisphaeraceae bacterium]
MSQTKGTIAVVGAGVVGLTTACRLLEAGWSVDVIASRRTPGTTSDRAGATFTPFGDGTVPEHVGWTAVGYATLKEIAGREGGASGVRMAALRDYMRSADPPTPWWADLAGGVVRRAAPAGYSVVFEAVLPHIDMTRYMPWLDARAVSMGARFVTREVRTLEELSGGGYAAAVNCSGLGAGRLCADAAVTPMRGQVLHAANTLGLNDSLHDEPEGGRVTYLFSFDRHVVMGGTYEPGVDREETEPGAIGAIVERCRSLLRADGHPRWAELGRDELRRVGGLRPARVIGGDSEAVRLEVEHRPGLPPIVHNYGHGRAGVSLSWGCAARAADLAGAAAGR